MVYIPNQFYVLYIYVYQKTQNIVLSFNFEMKTCIAVIQQGLKPSWRTSIMLGVRNTIGTSYIQFYRKSKPQTYISYSAILVN